MMTNFCETASKIAGITNRLNIKRLVVISVVVTLSKLSAIHAITIVNVFNVTIFYGFPHGAINMFRDVFTSSDSAIVAKRGLVRCVANLHFTLLTKSYFYLHLGKHAYPHMSGRNSDFGTPVANSSFFANSGEALR